MVHEVVDDEAVSKYFLQQEEQGKDFDMPKYKAFHDLSLRHYDNLKQSLLSSSSSSCDNVRWNVFIKATLVLLQDWEEEYKMIAVRSIKSLCNCCKSSHKYIRDRGILKLFEKPLEDILVCNYQHEEMVDSSLHCLIWIINDDLEDGENCQNGWNRCERLFLFVAKQASMEGKFRMLNVYWRRMLELLEKLDLMALKSVQEWLPGLMLHPLDPCNSDTSVALESKARLAILKFISNNHCEKGCLLQKRIVSRYGNTILPFISSFSSCC